MILKAFTLLELLVVMVLSMILTTIAFNAYLIMQRQYVSYKNRQHKILDVQVLSTLLVKDVQSEGLLKKDGQQLIFYQPSHDVVYEFEENKILRSQQTLIKNVDTFFFEYKRLSPYFQSKIVDNGLIDSLVLSVDFWGTNQQLIFKKNYSSMELIKGEKDEY